MLQTLYDLSGILSQGGGDMMDMAARASRKLKDILGAQDVHIVVFRDRRSLVPEEAGRKLGKQILEQGGEARNEFDRIAKRLLQIHNIEVVVPLSLKDHLLGAIILSPKTAGDRYGPEDMKFLGVFAYQAALTIDRARLLEEMCGHCKDPGARTAEGRALELEQMLLDISHRLQTPLTVVKTELESLKCRLDLPREIRSFERSIDHISKFVYDLLNLSALSVRREDVAMERLDLARLLSELAEYFRVMAGEEDISLAAGIEPDIFVFGNKEHLEELVMNLVSNSFKYQRPVNRRKVGIFLRKKDDRAVLVVADNGIGIPKEGLGRIFERFYRGGQALPGSVPGSGLGLAIAKKIAENHGGAISVESEVGKGTKVTVALPMR